MNLKITLPWKHRTQFYRLCRLLVLMPFALGTLNDFLGLPYGLRYLMDAAWVFLLVLLAVNYRVRMAPGILRLRLWAAAFVCYTLLTYLPNFQSPLYYLWGFRNNFRFYAAFFAFAQFLTREDIDDFFCLLEKLFWVNFLVSMIQYFGFGLKQDHLGGIFGTSSGCNAYTNAFLLIMVARSMILYLDKKESASTCACKCAASLVIAAFAELKFYFVEFMLTAALAVLIVDFTWRKLWILLGGGIAATAGAALLTAVFPSFSRWFSVAWFWETATATSGYTASGDLNRLTAIFSINDLWLKNGVQQIFGLGLGNCDTSSFAFLNTPFFRRNGHMHYTWMSYAHMYLECGWVGLFFFFGFFGLVFAGAHWMGNRTEGQLKNDCHVAQIMAALSAVIAVYNSTLRFEPGYMLYFVMAVPFAAARLENFGNRSKGAEKQIASE